MSGRKDNAEAQRALRCAEEKGRRPASARHSRRPLRVLVLLHRSSSGTLVDRVHTVKAAASRRTP